MKNPLLSAAIGDISGVPYEFEGRTKSYDAVDLLNPHNTYSDDTVCTFACAEALLYHKDMAECLHRRGREDFNRGFGHTLYSCRQHAPRHNSDCHGTTAVAAAHCGRFGKTGKSFRNNGNDTHHDFE